jgi:hypothetical protein
MRSLLQAPSDTAENRGDSGQRIPIISLMLCTSRFREAKQAEIQLFGKTQVLNRAFPGQRFAEHKVYTEPISKH